MKKYKNGAELFADARRSLLGNLSVAVWSFLLYTSITLLLNQIGSSFSFRSSSLSLLTNLTAGLITSVFASMLGVGLSSVFLNLQYGQPASVRDLLLPFLENADRTVRIRFFVTTGEYVSLLPLQFLLYYISADEILKNIPLVLGMSLLCFIAFTYWVTTYAMVNYLLLDFPDRHPGMILAASRKMMQGNRIRFILLILRLIPLHLLGIFSFGLANIWIGCCQHACTAAFYKDLMTPRSKAAAKQA